MSYGLSFERVLDSGRRARYGLTRAFIWVEGSGLTKASTVQDWGFLEGFYIISNYK